MTPPETPLAEAQAEMAGGLPAVSSCADDAATGHPAGTGAGPAPVAARLTVLAKRADFLRAAQARRQGTGAFLLQARRRDGVPDAGGDGAPGDAAATMPDRPRGEIRVGYTCSKKIGNAVARNRAKRRLRALARAVLPEAGQAGWDYVLVGRPGATVERPFSEMLQDLHAALARIHAGSDADHARYNAQRSARKGQNKTKGGGKPPAKSPRTPSDERGDGGPQKDRDR